ncbi:hypothetical protein ACLOJK_000949 [Asimina triloba]
MAQKCLPAGASILAVACFRGPGEEVERIADHAREVTDPPPAHARPRRVSGDAVELVDARDGVRERGAGPRLGVAHSPREVARSSVEEGGERGPQLVHGVRHFVPAVAEDLVLGVVGVREFGDAGNAGGGMVGAIQGFGGGRLGEVGGGLGLEGVGSESFLAEGTIPGTGAGLSEEEVLLLGRFSRRCCVLEIGG